jgi:hypothetical protein
MKTNQPIKYAMLCKRTNYPKLGYVIHKLKEQGIACRLFGESWHAPILEVDRSKLGEAWQVLGEKHGRYALDDVRDDHPKFLPYAEVTP